MAHRFRPSSILHAAFLGYVFSAALAADTASETLQQRVLTVQEEDLSHLFDEVTQGYMVDRVAGCMVEEERVGYSLGHSAYSSWRTPPMHRIAISL